MTKHFNATHGMSDTKTYRVWTAMKARCNNKKHKQFADYGGRGIRVCEEWQASFESFFTYMGNVPPGMSLDRWPDNDGNYEPGNCRWATPKENSLNRRSTHLLTHNGITNSLTDWAAQIGITRQGLRARLFKFGWPIDKALSQENRQ